MAEICPWVLLRTTWPLEPLKLFASMVGFKIESDRQVDLFTEDSKQENEGVKYNFWMREVKNLHSSVLPALTHKNNSKN